MYCCLQNKNGMRFLNKCHPGKSQSSLSPPRALVIDWLYYRCQKSDVSLVLKLKAIETFFESRWFPLYPSVNFLVDHRWQVFFPTTDFPWKEGSSFGFRRKPNAVTASHERRNTEIHHTAFLESFPVQQVIVLHVLKTDVMTNHIQLTVC